jgi:hypothetical protein
MGRHEIDLVDSNNERELSPRHCGGIPAMASTPPATSPRTRGSCG